MPVPFAAKGGQRKQTLRAVRRRIRGKSTVTVEEKGKKKNGKPKKNGKAKKDKLKEKMSAARVIEGAIGLVHRQKLSKGKVREAYVTADGKWVAGMSFAVSADYLEHVTAMMLAIQKKEITTHGAAANFLASRVSR